METTKTLRRKADKGDSFSMCVLAMHHFDGFMARRDPEKGLELVQKVKKLSSPYADYYLAYYYKHYDYSKRKDEKMRTLFSQASQGLEPFVEKKEPLGCYCYGMIHRKDTDKDMRKKVLECFLVAAEDGMTEAQYELGMLYSLDKKKEKQAREYIYQSAIKGYHKAQKAMGDCYRDGTLGISVSLKDANEWYKKAAYNGNHVAMKYLGQYYEGNGNPKRASYWYKKAEARKAID